MLLPLLLSFVTPSCLVCKKDTSEEIQDQRSNIVSIQTKSDIARNYANFFQKINFTIFFGDYDGADYIVIDESVDNFCEDGYKVDDTITKYISIPPPGKNFDSSFGFVKLAFFLLVILGLLILLYFLYIRNNYSQYLYDAKFHVKPLNHNKLQKCKYESEKTNSHNKNTSQICGSIQTEDTLQTLRAYQVPFSGFVIQFDWTEIIKTLPRISFSIPIMIRNDEYEESISQNAEFDADNNVINFSFEDAKLQMKPKNGNFLELGHYTDHFYLLNSIYYNFFCEFTKTSRSIKDIKKIIVSYADRLDIDGCCYYIIYKNEIYPFVECCPNEELLQQIYNFAKEIMKNNENKPLISTFMNYKYFRIDCSMSTFGNRGFIMLSAKNNHKFIVRSTERNFERLVVAVLPSYLLTFLPFTEKQNFEVLSKLVNDQRKMVFATVSEDLSLTSASIGGINHETIKSIINSLRSPDRQKWNSLFENKSSGVMTVNNFTSIIYQKYFSPLYQKPFVSFLVTSSFHTKNPIIELATIMNVQFFRRDYSIIGFSKLFNHYKLKNMVEIVPPSALEAGVNTFVQILLKGKTKLGYLYFFNNPNSAIHGFLAPAFDDNFTSCLNLLKINGGADFSVWLIDCDHFSPLWMVISQPSQAAENAHNIKDIVNLCHPEDAKVFQSSLDHILSVSSINITMEARMRINETDYEYYQINMSRRNTQFMVISILNIDEWKKNIGLLQDVDQSLNLALYYGQIIFWLFEDTSSPPRIYTNAPISQNHVIFNWTTIAHNVPGEFYDDFKNSLIHTLETNQQMCFESPMIFDTLRWYSVYGVSMRQEGEIIGLCFDITALKEAENEVKYQKEMQEEATKAKNRFLANMTHEIKTPLNGICGLIELLQTSLLNHEQTEMVATIRSAFEKLLELLNDTLDLQRIEQKKYFPQSVIFDPLVELSGAIAFTHRFAQNNDIPIVTFTDPKLPLLLKGDPTIFSKILYILLSNACKFTKSGHIDVKITYKADDTVKIKVKDTGIGMSDETIAQLFQTFQMGDSSVTRRYGGIGVGLSLLKKILDYVKGTISYKSEVNKGSTFVCEVHYESIYENYVPKLLFEKHYQVYFECKSNEIKRLVERHTSVFGFVLITNEKDIDITKLKLVVGGENILETVLSLQEKCPDAFYVIVVNDLTHVSQKKGITYLKRPVPVRSLYDLLKNALLGKNLTQKEEVQLKKGMSILSANANLTNQLVLKKMIERFSCNMTPASNGFEAVEQLQNHQFNLLIADRHMPIFDGHSLVKRVREMGDKISQIPIVLTYTDEDDISGIDADVILKKPITVANLKRAISEALIKRNVQIP
ncbi:hypothetical protein TRFO_34503 [Tritrichomonas foetus]|uniref:ATPase n=1 Tax=Tritrichomonas foetus TaxID=1144522 RepID=A0A1J4JL52_9EUKA|nr:hypothetical protein TRFO_34503 [Tritrichomonas foetus]|eukprot:OHS99143.1 hypothetical protein TRFO_34503 [Tritrichomonas foetus]